ncbi:HDOD domain-containing protein [Noviherbaspirillum saxi]|uniref:histidine kinase n=1 Tax=Noviherbaspirillum saxi TaxID=2320863 RepID=A0A3A3FFK2_9BURK|nr:HDOD domain-containing protein [Noviherbaspirillum saxi]RJF92030.1 HDOD domain-containing protein [Noviherbaspirillum saxi]
METSVPDIQHRLMAASLPALPQVLVQLISHCESEEGGMAALAELLSRDAALAMKVLRVAASPVYRRGPVPANLEQALTAIGIDMVRTLLLTESVYQTFNGFAATRGIDLRPFWAHAIATAISARAIADKLGYAQVEEAYLAGLLHDIGRLALVTAAPDEYAANFHAEDDDALCATEERTLEITHPEAGALLIEGLALDSFLADSIRYHHEPLERLQTSHPLVRLTALADAFATHAGSADGIPPAVARMAGFSQEEAREHAQTLAEQIAHLAASLGIEVAKETRPALLARRTGLAATAILGGDRLNEKVRDLILVSKTAEELRKFHDANACTRAIVKSSVVLFGFSDAIVLSGSAGSDILTPAALEDGRMRLSGLSLPLDEGNIAGMAALHGIAAFHIPPRVASVVEDQLLRFFKTNALVALRLSPSAEEPVVLLGAMSAGQAQLLRNRQHLLGDFGRQSGAILGQTVQHNDKAGFPDAALASEFQLAARRVAHEVNNPLSIIKNYLALLDRKADNKQAFGDDLSVVTEEVDRVAQIVNDFAQEHQARPDDSADVNGALAHAARMFSESGSLHPEVRIAHHASREPVRAAIDSRVFNQILINLVKNANEAMANGGRIDLRNAGLVPRDGRHWIAVSVIDTGPGIPDTLMPRLFSPIASAKDGPNRGLGLSIVHDLVTKAGGQISCRSSNAGTVFDILLRHAPFHAQPEPGERG